MIVGIWTLVPHGGIGDIYTLLKLYSTIPRNVIIACLISRSKKISFEEAHQKSIYNFFFLLLNTEKSFYKAKEFGLLAHFIYICSHTIKFQAFDEGYSLDQIKMTEWIWPNEYDRNRWTWPKNWQQRTLTWWMKWNEMKWVYISS